MTALPPTDHLARELNTPLGVFPAGTPVRPLTVALNRRGFANGVRVCLDDPDRPHLGRCHAATVATEALAGGGARSVVRGLNTGRLRRGRAA